MVTMRVTVRGAARFARRRPRSPGLTRAAHDRAGEAAEIEIRAGSPIAPACGTAWPPARLSTSTVSRWSSSVGPVVPGRALARGDHIVAVARRDRDRDDAVESQIAPRSRGTPPTMRSNMLLREIDEIDLVDRQHDVADAEQRDDIGVAARLRQHALARIDQDDGEIGVRGAGRHVARVLLVARRVGDDEFALVGREEAIGDVDGDALLALGLQPVDQKREIDILAGRAVLARILGRARPDDPRRSAWCRRAAARSAWTCRHRRCRR